MGVFKSLIPLTRRPRSVTLWSACALALCSTFVFAADVSQRDWQRYTDDAGIEMLADIGDDHARQLMRELVRFEPIVDEYIEPFSRVAKSIAPRVDGAEVQAAGRQPLELLVMKRRRDFVRLFRPRHFAAFTLPTLQKTLLAVGPMGNKDSLREHLLHEYVHFRLRRDVPGGLPLWFEEGLATFLSQARFTGARPGKEKRQADSSEEQPSLKVSMGYWRPSFEGNYEQLPIMLARRDLRGLDSKDRNLRNNSGSGVRNFYRSAHAMVRYLYLDVKVDRNALAGALVRGDAGFPGSIGVRMVDASRAVRLLFIGKYSPLQHYQTVEPPPREIAVADVPSLEVRRVLAEIAAHTNPAQAQKLFSQVANETPELGWPWLGQSFTLRVQQEMAQALTALNRAEQLLPDDPRMLVERAALRTAGCIAERAEHCPKAWRAAMLDLRDALDGDPTNYDAIYRLGITHLFMGQPGEAVGYLQIAWQRVPWSPRVNYFVGESMRLLGDTRARWYLTNAQRWASSGFFQKAAEIALAALPATRHTPQSPTARLSNGD